MCVCTLGWPILYRRKTKSGLQIGAPPKFFAIAKTNILGKFQFNIPTGRGCSMAYNIKEKMENPQFL